MSAPTVSILTYLMRMQRIGERLYERGVITLDELFDRDKYHEDVHVWHCATVALWPRATGVSIDYINIAKPECAPIMAYHIKQTDEE